MTVPRRCSKNASLSSSAVTHLAQNSISGKLCFLCLSNQAYGLVAVVGFSCLADGTSWGLLVKESGLHLHIEPLHSAARLYLVRQETLRQRFPTSWWGGLGHPLWALKFLVALSCRDGQLSSINKGCHWCLWEQVALRPPWHARSLI